MPDSLLTSAEMTAYWRSQNPELSGDQLSALLVSEEGINLANNFKSQVYPLIEHHLALRNRFFFTRALRLLKTGNHDVCISIGSGLSLLNYYLADEIPNVVFYDMDLPEVLRMRNERLLKIKDRFKTAAWERVRSQPIDLEKSFAEKKNLKELLPACFAPIFIVEGVFYYLSQGCLVWFLSETSKYKNGALLFDYWPEDELKKSSTTKKMLDFLAVSIKERVKMFHNRNEIQKLAAPKKIKEDPTIQEVESEFVKKPLLVDIDQIVPCRYVVIR